MPRPTKCRRICALPQVTCFGPRENAAGEVVLTLDEYEAVRLIDLEGMTQETCAAQMEVARTTVQAVYDSARKKLADAVVNGRSLVIRGGAYRVCPRAQGCPHSCGRRRCQMTKAEENDMKKIAVTYENGQVFGHFGHTQQFKIYDVADGKVAASAVVPTNGSGHGALAGFLASCGVDTLICGGIGGGARTALAQAGIALYPGASGDADAAVAALLAGTLAYDPDTVCAHHEHHGEEHACGEHGCGNH